MLHRNCSPCPSPRCGTPLIWERPMEADSIFHPRLIGHRRPAPSHNHSYRASFISIACGLFFCTAVAQNSPIVFENITTRDGLSNNIVQSAFQDSRGFMWFGTLDGLNRYDGRRMKVYHTDPDDSSSVSTPWISAITEDALGDLWVLGFGSINRYNRMTDNFTRFPLHLKGLLGSPQSVLVDQEGNVWAAFYAGVWRFDRATGDVSPVDLGHSLGQEHLHRRLVRDVCLHNDYLGAANKRFWEPNRI
jgi:ligand-binding sensor domain-containing protein